MEECKPVTDQKSSGRCWIFALLNCMRLPMVKQFKVSELEFSQNYLFFWDKVNSSRSCVILCNDTNIVWTQVLAILQLSETVLVNEFPWQVYVFNLVENLIGKACIPMDYATVIWIVNTGQCLWNRSSLVDEGSIADFHCAKKLAASWIN